MKVLVKENTKLEQKFLKLLLKLPPEQFFGVATILNIDIINKEKEEENNELVENIASAPESIEKNQDNDSEEDVKVLTIEEEETFENNTDAAEDTIEEESKNFKDALSILTECLDKFKALSTTQKKNLLRLVKAGV